MSKPFSVRRISFPLGLQLMILIVAILAVAQLVTLALTVLIPPAPQQRWDLTEVSQALKSGVSSDRLEIKEMNGPPDLSDSGWLVSAGSRDALAQKLGRTNDQVVLAFYTLLPVGGIAVPYGPPAVKENASLGVDRWFVPAAQAQAMPGGPPPGGMPPGGAPGGGFPGGPPPGARPPVGTPPPGGARSPAGLPGRSSGESISQKPSAPAQAPAQGNAQQPAPQAAGAVSAPVGTPPPVAAPPPGSPLPAVNMPRLPLGGLGNADKPPIARADKVPTKESTLPPKSSDSQTAPTSPSRQTQLSDAAIQAQKAEVQQPGYVPRGASPASTVRPSGVTQTIPFRRQQGFFAFATPPFIEGDFIAAVRNPDGTWTAVAPRAEPFPNAWQKRVMAWFALSLLLVAPAGWFFARRIVRPLESFARAAETLGRDPAATVATLRGPAEIGRAAHAFNLMRNRLRAFVDDRTAMVGAISHDLRTPLTRLRFRIEDVPEEQQDGLRLEVDEMELLITQVVTFIRDASTPGARESLDLVHLVRHSVDGVEVLGGKIDFDATDPIAIEADPVGMRRVLVNLLENAIKYGQSARVRLSRDSVHAVAEIIDSGPGIDLEDQERVFEPFYRSSAAVKSGKPGSGIGLAVCRSIARAHGGDICFDRTDEGFVTRLTLPLGFASELRSAA